MAKWRSNLRRWDCICAAHGQFHNYGIESGICWQLWMWPERLREHVRALRYSRDATSGVLSDFCQQCYLHETEHTSTMRCLTGATRFEAPR